MYHQGALERFGRTELFTYFLDGITKASVEQGVRFSHDAQFYLVGVLLKAVEGIPPVEGIDAVLSNLLASDLPLTDGLAEFKQQEIGDKILFQTGFFPDRLMRRSSLELFHMAGSNAYKQASGQAAAYRSIQTILRELGENFQEAAGLITEIRIGAEVAGIKMPADEHRLFLGYKATGNPIYRETVRRYRAKPDKPQYEIVRGAAPTRKEHNYVKPGTLLN